jgi:hypothetical protein
MPQELQKHLRGGDQGAVEGSLVEAELGFNEGAQKEAIYRLSDGTDYLHFPSEERLAEAGSPTASGAKLIGFAPPEGMVMSNVQDALVELHDSILSGPGGLTGNGTAGRIPLWSDGDSLTNSAALSESMNGAVQKGLSIHPLFTSDATGEMNALEILPDLTQITATTEAAAIRIKSPTVDGGASAGNYYGLFIEDLGGVTGDPGPVGSAFAIYVEDGMTRLTDLAVDGELSVNGSADIIGGMHINGALAVTPDGPLGSFGLLVNPRGFTDSVQYFELLGGEFSAAATSSMTALYVEASTAAGAYTTPDLFNLRIKDVAKGAGHAITRQYGLKIEDQTKGATNYAIHTGSGGIRLGALAGSGTRMVVVDSNGNLSTQPLP